MATLRAKTEADVIRHSLRPVRACPHHSAELYDSSRAVIEFAPKLTVREAKVNCK